jgi:hypothetical protein
MNQQIPFAQQRLVLVALLLGMTMYAIAAGIVLQTNDGKGIGGDAVPPFLETIVLVAGVALAAASFQLRSVLTRRAAAAEAEARSAMRFQSRLIPIAMLEGGCLFAITVWLLTGNTVPSLVVALVLLSLAIAQVPFQDPDTGG